MLKKRDSKLAKAKHQLNVLSNGIFLDRSLPTFADKIKKSGQFPLRSKKLEILQVNVGYMCNQVCAHSHVDAGPGRNEIKTNETMQQCLNTLEICKVKTLDLI